MILMRPMCPMLVEGLRPGPWLRCLVAALSIGLRSAGVPLTFAALATLSRAHDAGAQAGPVARAEPPGLAEARSLMLSGQVAAAESLARAVLSRVEAGQGRQSLETADAL